MITPTTSQGLMGLPHFKTSRAAMELFEPVWTNLYCVNFKLPSTLGLTNDENNLIIEGITKIGGLNTNKVPAAGSNQAYKFATRRFADSGPSETTLDISMDMEVNMRGNQAGQPDLYTLKTLRRWTDMIYDPLTGRMGLKADYVADWCIITMHDKAMHPFWQWTLYNIWPTSSIPEPNLDFMQKNQLYKITGLKFACDYWDEIML